MDQWHEFIYQKSSQIKMNTVQIKQKAKIF